MINYIKRPVKGIHKIPFRNLELEIPTDFKVAEEQRVSIVIDGLYGWGVGYIVDPDEYKDNVYPKFIGTGYEMEESRFSGACSRLYSPEEGNKLDLYMHPMSYDGYASPADAAKVAAILSECPLVKGVRIDVIEEIVYDLSDEEYEAFLKEHKDEIINGIKEFLATGGDVSKGDIGFDFAREARIPRVGDGAGLCSSDTDIRVITEIFKEAVENGAFDDYDINKTEFGGIYISGKQKENDGWLTYADEFDFELE